MRATALALLLVGVALFAPGPAFAEPLREIFSAANRAYFAGDFESAITGYERLVDAGIADPDVFYNLGLAHARRSSYGKAIVAFEKSLVLRPGDADAEKALDSVREAVAQRRATREGEATTVDGGGLLGALGSLLPESTLAYLVLALNLIAFGALAGLLWTRNEPVRVALGVTAPVAFALLVLSGLALLGRTEALADGQAGIVVEDRAVLLEGPDPNAVHAGELREGERVRVLARHESYYEVVASDDVRGWVDRDAIGRIDVHSAGE